MPSVPELPQDVPLTENKVQKREVETIQPLPQTQEPRHSITLQVVNSKVATVETGVNTEKPFASENDEIIASESLTSRSVLHPSERINFPKISCPIHLAPRPPSNMSPSDDSGDDSIVDSHQSSDENAGIRTSRVSEWHLKCTTANREIQALVDTGASVSMISTSTFQSLNPRPKLFESSLKIRGISGAITPVAGVTEMTITIAGERYLGRFVVMNTKEEMLLGADFLSEFDVKIDFGKGTINIGSAELILDKPNSKRQFVYGMNNTVTIPPNSEVVVPLDICSRNHEAYARNLPVVLEPSDTLTKSGAILGQTLTGCRKPFALLLNSTSNEIIVQPMRRFAVGQIPDMISSKPIERPLSVNVVLEEEDSNPLVDINLLPKPLRDMIPQEFRNTSKENTLVQLLYNYRDIFVTQPGELGRTDVMKHEINTGDAAPIRVPKRRLPAKQEEIVSEELKKMIEKGVVEESTSPWSSPVVIVKKKDGTHRFCVDYRELNNVTHKDSYPLPHIEDTLQSLHGARYFCSLDLASGYWQIEMDEESKAKTAFKTREGLYQFNVMPFGLCNAPATFERLMDKILRGMVWDRCMCYLDDIIVYGGNFRQTLENLEKVFGKLRNSGLKLKPTKCNLFKEELLYLGFIVSGEGVSSDPAKLDSLRNWPEPCTVPDIRAFLGLTNYHRKLIKNYAEIAEPLIDLTRSNRDFVWTKKHSDAFSMLRQQLLDAPMLHHPSRLPEDTLILDTDASLTAIGGVLSQYSALDHQEHNIAFASKTLTKTQRNYCATYRELLAIVDMIRHFRHFLWGRRFIVRTDHASLRWLKNYKDVDGMLARWLARLEEYHFDIRHRPGNQHSNADGLSRCHTCTNPECAGKLSPPIETSESDDISPIACVSYGDCLADDSISSCEGRSTPAQKHQTTKLDNDIDEMSWLEGYSKEDIASAQLADSSTSEVHKWINSGYKPSKAELQSHSAEIRTLMSRRNQLKIENGILYKMTTARTGKPIAQIVLPLALRNDVLHDLHDLKIVGHLGIQRTIYRVQQKFYWPGLALDVARWCAKCHNAVHEKVNLTRVKHP